MWSTATSQRGRTPKPCRASRRHSPSAVTCRGYRESRFGAARHQGGKSARTVEREEFAKGVVIEVADSGSSIAPGCFAPSPIEVGAGETVQIEFTFSTTRSGFVGDAFRRRGVGRAVDAAALCYVEYMAPPTVATDVVRPPVSEPAPAGGPDAPVRIEVAMPRGIFDRLDRTTTARPAAGTTSTQVSPSSWPSRVSRMKARPLESPSCSYASRTRSPTGAARSRGHRQAPFA